MHWLPELGDFGQRLRAARTAPEGSRLAELASLAQGRLSFLETIQLDRAFTPAVAEEKADFERVRLAVLSSCTIDHLIPGIRVAGLRRRLLIDVYKGAYGQYRQEVLGPDSNLHAFRPDTVLLSLTCREPLAAVSVDASADGVRNALTDAVTDIRALWRTARERFNAAVVQQTYLDVTEPLFGGLDPLIAGAPPRLVMQLNDDLAQAAAADGVSLLDIARASARDGLAMWFDNSRWLQGKLEIAPQAAPMYGELVARLAIR